MIRTLSELYKRILQIEERKKEVDNLDFGFH